MITPLKKKKEKVSEILCSSQNHSQWLRPCQSIKLFLGLVISTRLWDSYWILYALWLGMMQTDFQCENQRTMTRKGNRIGEREAVCVFTMCSS